MSRLASANAQPTRSAAAGIALPPRPGPRPLPHRKRTVFALLSLLACWLSAPPLLRAQPQPQLSPAARASCESSGHRRHPGCRALCTNKQPCASRQGAASARSYLASASLPAARGRLAVPVEASGVAGPRSSAAGFRVFLGPGLALGGRAFGAFAAEDAGTMNRALDLGGLFEAGAEYKLDHRLGVSAEVRLGQSPAVDYKQRVRTVELLASPVLHFLPGTPFELLLQLPVGICGADSDLPSPGGVAGGWGLSIGVTMGVITWINPRIGVYGQIGVIGQTSWHDTIWSTMQLSLVRPVFNLGVNFGF